MKLLYLTAGNLRSTPFVKDLVYNYKEVGKSILVHDHFGGLSDTRFVSKRISALMSEEMITNQAVSGDQRSLFQWHEGQVSVRKELLETSLKTVDLLVVNAIGIQDGVAIAIDPLMVVHELRKAFGLQEVYLFAKNSRSPMVANPHRFEIAESIQALLTVYEEEAEVLRAAQSLVPAVVASPSNFLKAMV